VVFISLKEQAGRKWGTPQPVTVRDAEFGAIRLRAFGTYSFKVADLKLFVEKVLGTTSEVWVDTLDTQLRSAIVTAIATALGPARSPSSTLPPISRLCLTRSRSRWTRLSLSGACPASAFCRKRQPA
jgi:membrane protease subunit (stomatin/prohibitin family)